MTKPAAAPRTRAMRLTRQRKILLDLIDKTGQHLDAESLFQLAQKTDPKLNRVTVYRTLKLLKQGGLVDELDLMHQAGEQHFYETRQKAGTCPHHLSRVREGGGVLRGTFAGFAEPDREPFRV